MTAMMFTPLSSWLCAIFQVLREVQDLASIEVAIGTTLLMISVGLTPGKYSLHHLSSPWKFPGYRVRSSESPGSVAPALV